MRPTQHPTCHVNAGHSLGNLCPVLVQCGTNGPVLNGRYMKSDGRVSPLREGNHPLIHSRTPVFRGVQVLLRSVLPSIKNRDNKKPLHLKGFCAPGGTRTPNRQGRNLLLYPLSYERLPVYCPSDRCTPRSRVLSSACAPGGP